MAYPNKPSSAPAIPFNSVGKSKNLNDIFSAIAVEKLLALKTDGTYDNNFSIGDNTLNSLVNEINIRQGSNIKEYDNTGANLLRTLTLGSATNLAQGFRYLDEPIKISNNATNPLTEIDISAGVMTFDDGTGQVRLTTNLTQSTANDFDNGGLLPNGTVLQTNTMYYAFVIYSSGSNLVSFYADTDPNGGNIPQSPNSYDKKELLVPFYVDSSGNILGSKMVSFGGGKYYVYYNLPQGQASYTALNTPTLRSVRTPPNTIAIIGSAADLPAGSGDFRVRYSNQNVSALSNVNDYVGYYINSFSTSWGRSQIFVETNSNSQIYESIYTTNTNANSTQLTTYGFLKI